MSIPQMNRRNFLKIIAASGLAAYVPCVANAEKTTIEQIARPEDVVADIQCRIEELIARRGVPEDEVNAAYTELVEVQEYKGAILPDPLPYLEVVREIILDVACRHGCRDWFYF